jgi:hypothetical protein
MNYLSISFLALIATVLSDTSLQPQYFVGYINGATQWAYPLDMCAQTGLSGSQYVTCDDTGSIAIVNTYTDAACKTLKKQTNYTSADVTATGVYDFNCVGTVDYIETSIFVGGCTAKPTLVTYGVVNVCFGFESITINSTTYTVYEKVQCTGDLGTISNFIGPSTYAPSVGCSPKQKYSQYYDDLLVEPTCSFYTTLLTESVYAQITDCVYNGVSQFPQIESNSDMYPGTDFQTVYNYWFWVSPTESELITNDTTVDLCNIPWLSLFEVFNGTQITVTTQCTTRPNIVEQTGLGSVFVEATIGFYQTPTINGTLIPCDFNGIELLLLQDYLDLLYPDGADVTGFNCTTQWITTSTAASVETTTAATTKSSLGNMQGVNFVALVLCFVFMYIF